MCNVNPLMQNANSPPSPLTAHLLREKICLTRSHLLRVSGILAAQIRSSSRQGNGLKVFVEVVHEGNGSWQLDIHDVLGQRISTCSQANIEVWCGVRHHRRRLKDEREKSLFLHARSLFRKTLRTNSPKTTHDDLGFEF